MYSPRKKLFLLIRLSPYPFNLLNVLFATTNISLAHYTLGTALSLLKISLHIYVGANLTSFAKHIMGNEDDMTEGERRAVTVRYIAVVTGSVLATAVMIYVYIVAKRAVAEISSEDSEEATAFLARNDEEAAYAHDHLDDDWVAWNEEDEEDEHYVPLTERRHSDRPQQEQLSRADAS